MNVTNWDLSFQYRKCPVDWTKWNLHNKLPHPLQFHTNVLNRSIDEMLPYNSYIQVFVVGPDIYQTKNEKPWNSQGWMHNMFSSGH